MLFMASKNPLSYQTFSASFKIKQNSSERTYPKHCEITNFIAIS